MNYRLETQLAQTGNHSCKTTGAINPPIYLSTAYSHEGIGLSSGYDYSRTGNPTREVLESSIAKLENGDQGFACSSGMAAIQIVFSLFKKGDDILVSADLYGGSYRLFNQILTKYGLTFQSGDLSSFKEQLTANTKAIFIETPTNPLMQEFSIKEIANFAKKHNLLLIVDNTFYTPLLQRPINDGADIVVHSATKYLGGHNDVLGGLIVAKGPELCTELKMLHNAIGSVLSPFDSWLVIRGMKTLALRMQQHEKNAYKVAKFLNEQDVVTDVIYPGRGGMLSFRLQKEEWVDPFLRHIQLITFAESLGGVESFITYPATQTHAEIPEEVRIKNGVCNRLLRFSVGIEHAEDLITDLEHAFYKMKG